MITRLSQLPRDGLVGVDESTALAAIMLVLLLALLIEREILRCSTGRRALIGAQALQIAIAPLLIAFFVIIIARFTTIL